jgi:hypothetical protein
MIRRNKLPAALKFGSRWRGRESEFQKCLEGLNELWFWINENIQHPPGTNVSLDFPGDRQIAASVSANRTAFNRGNWAVGCQLSHASTCCASTVDLNLLWASIFVIVSQVLRQQIYANGSVWSTDYA